MAPIRPHSAGNCTCPRAPRKPRPGGHLGTVRQGNREACKRRGREKWKWERRMKGEEVGEGGREEAEREYKRQMSKLMRR